MCSNLNVSSCLKSNNYARSQLLNAIFLTALTFIVYWPVLKYFFVGDDWIILNIFKHEIVDNWLKLFIYVVPDPSSCRPIALLFDLLRYKVFGLNPFFFNISGLFIHAVNSVLVVHIAKKITRNNIIGWSAGYLYAFSVYIHITPLTWSVAGIYEVLGAFFLYTTLILFLNGRFRVSAVVYLLAVFSKPSTLFAPFILLIFLKFNNNGKNETWIASFKKLIWHFIILFTFFIHILNFIFFIHSSHGGIALSLWGPHLFDKFLWYISLIPRAILPSGSAQVIFVVYALLAML
ncbi:MAG: hypothetical protein KKA52_02590, partial [Candidatus Omnitrophica bacterium]|nr:hypothetical protein [Candidatus Omnitrophota bacterium]